MRRGAFLSVWLGACVWAGAQTPRAETPPPPPPEPGVEPSPDQSGVEPDQKNIPAGKIRHLRLSGDLDCERLARDFTTELDEAASQGVALVLVELDGNRARPDLVLGMGRRLAECRVRTAAYLADGRDRRVGLGQAVLAALCGDAFIAPGTRIVHAPDDECRGLADPRMDWAEIAEELVLEVGPRIESRGGDPRLAALLLSPRGAAWFVQGADGERIEADRPEGGTQFVFFGGSDLDRIEIGPELAASLRLVRGASPGVARVLGELGGKSGATRGRTELASGLPEAERRLVRSISDLRVSVERIEETLRVTTSKLDRRALPGDYRRAGDAALSQIVAAERVLDGLNSLTAEYPELLREGARTPAASRERALADVRRDLERHRATAEEYRSRR